MPIAAVVNGQTYAVHSDHLNTPRKLTQANGQAVWQWAYSAFGDEQPTTAAKRFTSEMTNPTTGTTSIPDVTFNLRYPGQYFDKETGLHYNYFRTYAPGTGRYTQSDPIGLDGGWNRFTYVDGDPLSFFDPDGLQASGGRGDRGRDDRGRDIRPPRTPPEPGAKPAGQTPNQSYQQCMDSCWDEEFPMCYAVGAGGACAGAGAGPMGALILGTVTGGGCFIAKQRTCRSICSR